MIKFGVWLLGQRDRHDLIGELACELEGHIKRGSELPATAEDMTTDAQDALKQARIEWLDSD